MMSVPLHREEHEGGCPIKMAVRGPCQRPSSPPHDTVTGDGEVIALVFPDVKDDLRESARQRDPGDFLAPPLFHRMEPGPQRAGPTHRGVAPVWWRVNCFREYSPQRLRGG